MEVQGGGSQFPREGPMRFALRTIKAPSWVTTYLNGIEYYSSWCSSVFGALRPWGSFSKGKRNQYRSNLGGRGRKPADYFPDNREPRR